MTNTSTAIGHIMTEATTACPKREGYFKAPDPDLYPFEPHCIANGITKSMAWRLVKAGDLKTVKIRARTYVTRREWNRFLKSLAATPVADALDPSTPFEI